MPRRANTNTIRLRKNRWAARTAAAGVFAGTALFIAPANAQTGGTLDLS